jgi:tetratricopeptide (TPR) repeat protein
MKIQITLFVLAFKLAGNFAFGQNIEKANLLKDHGLKDEAKSECINIITSSRPDTDKASAYYILGMIAFEEQRLHVALETWSNLVKRFPKSKEATLVTARLKDLAQVVSETGREALNNATAENYLSHGEFWTRGKSEVFNIDTSWIPNIESGVKWYDKMIEEFPGTAASRIGYEKKIKSLLGWKEPGRNGESHGLEEDFNTYMPRLLETFLKYEAAFPESGTLQAFRYQIAQAYWKKKQFDQTRKWLAIIVAKSGTSDTFYADLAKRRLQKVEY